MQCNGADGLHFSAFNFVLGIPLINSTTEQCIHLQILSLIRGAQNFSPTGLMSVLYMSMSTLRISTHVPMNIHHSGGSPRV